MLLIHVHSSKLQVGLLQLLELILDLSIYTDSFVQTFFLDAR